MSFRSVRRISTLAAIVVVTTSCLGLRVETRFNADGSGTMVMRMVISNALLEMGEGDASFDIPLNRKDMESAFADVDGVILVEVVVEETEENRIITSIVDFDRFEAPLGANDSPVDSARLRVDGETTIYSLNVGEAKMTGGDESPIGVDGLDEAMLSTIQALLEGYSMEYLITAPSQVIRHSHGELTEDGRSVLLVLPMADYFALDEPYTVEVVW